MNKHPQETKSQMRSLMPSDHIHTHLAFLSAHQSKWKAARFHLWVRPSWLTRHPGGGRVKHSSPLLRHQKTYKKSCSEKQTLKASCGASETPPSLLTVIIASLPALVLHTLKSYTLKQNKNREARLEFSSMRLVKSPYCLFVNCVSITCLNE